MLILTYTLISGVLSLRHSLQKKYWFSMIHLHAWKEIDIH